MTLTVQRLLLLIAIALFVIFALIDTTTLHWTHPNAYLGFGLAAFAAGHL